MDIRKFVIREEKFSKLPDFQWSFSRDLEFIHKIKIIKLLKNILEGNL